ncbi:MAG: hypothetical protein LBG67_01670 [Campylobacteraceae bacterium]|nr:hypothetical protein [Campylobacteraceae bacterium]
MDALKLLNNTIDIIDLVNTHGEIDLLDSVKYGLDQREIEIINMDKGDISRQIQTILFIVTTYLEDLQKVA